MVRWSDGKTKNKKQKKIFFFPSNFFLSIYETTEFERTNNLRLYLKEQQTNFERTLFDQTTYPALNSTSKFCKLKQTLLKLFIQEAFLSCFILCFHLFSIFFSELF
jgi:hypothetical protein